MQSTGYFINFCKTTNYMQCTVTLELRSSCIQFELNHGDGHRCPRPGETVTQIVRSVISQTHLNSLIRLVKL